MKILIISGKSGSGKDTIATMMREELEKMGKKVLIIHFADPVKWFARDCFGWDGQKDVAGRTLLQTLGTDWVRTYDEDYWVDIISRFISVMNKCNVFDYVLIPDARFPNEISGVYLRNPYAKSLRIDRYNEDGSYWLNPILTPEQHKHPSEVSLDEYHWFDYKVRNDKDLTNLRNISTDIIRRMEAV